MHRRPAHSLPNLSSHALYRSFFHGFSDEIYLHDDAGIIVDVNQAACINLGYPLEELLGKKVSEISVGLDDAQLVQLWRSIEAGPHIVATNCHRRKDGSFYHLEVHISCQEFSGRKFFLAVARRTDEKRQRLDEIQQLNARLQTLLQERTQLWRESSRLLNAVMEQTPDAIFIKDLQGRYIYANDALARQLQISVADLLGKTDDLLYPAEQAKLFQQTDQEVLNRSAPCVYEDRMHTGSGLVFVNSMKTPYRDDEGKVVGVLGISRDVSEMRHAQEQMAHNYEMLRQAERIAKIGSWTLELTTNTFNASEMLSEMNGLTPKDPPLTPETLSAMLPPEQHAILSKAIGKCIQEGTPYTVDVEHKRPGGGTFPARIRGQAYRNKDGQIILLHGTLQDLSEHMEAEQRLQNLADNLPNGAIFRCEQTRDGKLFLRYVSAGIQRLLGVSAAQFTTNQTTFTSLIFEDDKPTFFATVQRSLKSRTAFDLVSRIVTPEGHQRWMRARAVPRQTHQSVLWEGILLDVTVEYEVQASLRQAKEAAESAERVKSEFLATMSHEIRTPMNTVLGMTQLLQQTPMSAKQRNYIDKVSLSANALLSLINEILDFSKLEAEMLQIDPVPFQLEDLLETVASVTGLRAEQKGLEIIYNIAPSVPRELIGDLPRLSQVLTNLVGNAIKFTEHGEVVIRMHAQPDNAQPSDLRLFVTVMDTGIGIPADLMEQLFEPFMQGEAHISRRFGGTGLGLAICHKLVHLMDGDIHVQSKLGQGSSFSFHVRLQAQNADIQRKNLSLPLYRVLVVDDNAMARDTLSEMVEGFGLTCSTASSGPQALAFLQEASREQQPFQLVLMDWQMPEMDGLQTAELIRRDTQVSDTPAMLMVTAYCRDEVLNRVTELEMQGLLIKPVTESVLFNAIQEALQLRPTQSGLHIRGLSPHPTLQVPETLRGRRILVVDDNQLNREVAQDFLELAGVAVTTAQSGREALALLSEHQFDAILLDVQMPEMDGLEVARRIRQDAQWQQLPIWALTAQARVEDRQAILASGMNGQLTKPINAQWLYQTLDQALACLPPSPPPTAAAPPPQSAGIARHFAGQQERMQRLLRAFVRDFSQAPEQLISLHRAQDWKNLTMLAHTLKGSLGYLDSAQAMQAMESLEWASEHEQVSASLVHSAAQYLQEVLDNITQSTPAQAEASSPKLRLDCATLITQINQALPAIQRGEYTGIQALEAVEAELRGSTLHGLAARALSLTEDLEIQAACDSLRELQNALHQFAPDSPSDPINYDI